VNFEELRTAGDPAALAKRYNHEGIDEVVVLDVTATIEGRRAFEETIRAVSGELFIPLTVGGGIRSESDAAAAIDAGADKVGVNSAALADPPLLTRLSARYGSQAVVVAIDAKRVGDHWEVFTHGGRNPTGIDASEWAARMEHYGAGEILLTSMDRDGTKAGYDLPLTRTIANSVDIPVIASGGVGNLEHIYEGLTEGGASAALAASIFHFREFSIADCKRYLETRNVAVRPLH